MSLALKVCGLKQPRQIISLVEMGVDFIGINFYPHSKRYYSDSFLLSELTHLPSQKVGVFVDGPLEEVIAMAALHRLDFVQLHGDESPDYCEQVRKHLPVIKALPGKYATHNEVLKGFHMCDYFLFDTATGNLAGRGIPFDHATLSAYDFDKPYFLAGGLGPDFLDGNFQKSAYPGLYALDINSKFEEAPGIKDLETIASFKIKCGQQ